MNTFINFHYHAYPANHIYDTSVHVKDTWRGSSTLSTSYTWIIHVYMRLQKNNIKVCLINQHGQA